MQSTDDIQVLFSEAATELRISEDVKFEALRLKVARGEVFGSAITPATIGQALGVSDIEARRYFAALRSAGFIQHHHTQFVWANIDPQERARNLDILSMIEANVALRCRYLDMSPVLPALLSLVATIEQYGHKDDRLGVCLAAQRLFLTLVGSVNAPRLFLEYRAYANASLVYSWSMSLTDTARRISDAIADMVHSLGEGDGASAARTAIRLRKPSQASERRAIPLTS